MPERQTPEKMPWYRRRRVQAAIAAATLTTVTAGAALFASSEASGPSTPAPREAAASAEPFAIELFDRTSAEQVATGWRATLEGVENQDVKDGTQIVNIHALLDRSSAVGAIVQGNPNRPFDKDPDLTAVIIEPDDLQWQGDSALTINQNVEPAEDGILPEPDTATFKPAAGAYEAAFALPANAEAGSALLLYPTQQIDYDKDGKRQTLTGYSAAPVLLIKGAAGWGIPGIVDDLKIGTHDDESTVVG